MRYLLVLGIAALLTLTETPATRAGGGGYDAAPTGLNDSLTNRVSKMLTKGVRGCWDKLDKPYRYDCYRDVYQSSARLLEGNPAYDGARKALLDVEASLTRTIQKNADPAAPRARRGLKSFQAIRPEALPSAKQDFVKALDSGYTQLLRSPSSGTHYTRIAQALETNKLLLRSAMLMLPVPDVMKAALIRAMALPEPVSL